MHPTHDKGDVAEAAIILDLTKKGFVVFKPLTQNTYADLVVIKDDRIETVQVKYVSPVDGKLIVPLRKQSSNAKGTTETYKYRETPLNWIAVYSPDPELCIYLPRSLWADNAVTCNLRTIRPKNNQVKGIMLATDYLTI